ncbi:MAG: hypothetical protein NVSMB2_21240 [Chloroflexota bacterium]
MSRASVQSTRLGIVSIEDGVVVSPDGECHAILEVQGTPSPHGDELRENALVAGFATFLNALSYPVQIVVRATPVDLTGYVASVEERARELGENTLAALAHDHALFVQGLARQRILIERRFYLVVGAEHPARAGQWWQRFRATSAPEHRDDEPRREAARHQLTFRCDEILRQLQRCGLGLRRLGDEELASLYIACWSPERARVQRIRQQLHEYTTLAVRRREQPFAGARR